MPKQKIGLKSAKRFGVRYGPTNKLKLSIIETEQRKFQPCPVCGKARAAWKSVGIFQCGKCNAKFTARAYSAAKTVISEIVEATPEAVVEEE